MNLKKKIINCKDPTSKDVNNSQLQNNNNLGQTTCSIINESVTSIFNKLKTARHADSTWILKIILNILTPQCISNLLAPSTTPINNTHIAPFLQVPSVQLVIILSHKFNYPEHCTFCLEVHNSMADSKSLTSKSIAAASKMENL